MTDIGSKAADRFFNKQKQNKKDALWSIVKENYDSGMDSRRPYDQRWALNMAFLMGKQYSFFNKSSHLIQQLKKVKGKRRNIDNQLISRWNRQVGDLIRTNPAMSVIPLSNDDEDIKAAKMGDRVIKHFWRSNRMRKKLRQLAGWIYSCGNGFLDDRWNPKLGPIDYNEKGEIVYSGDADCGVWSPFEVVVPAGYINQTDIHAMPWIDKVKWRGLDWFKNHYPKRGSEVMAEQMVMPVMEAAAFSGTMGAANGKQDGAFMHNFYVQPCSQFPKGKFIAAANGIVLETQDYPFTYYHIEQFKAIDIPGVFWGACHIEYAITLQNRWNTTINGIDEYNRLCAKGKLLVPRGSKLETNPDDSHGEILTYKPVMGHKPDMLTLKGVPATYSTSLVTIKDSLQDLFSQHEITRGTNKSDIRSGEMVSLLREQDAYGAIPTFAVFEESLEAVVSRILKRIQAGYKEERAVQIVGSEGEFEIAQFKGADLRNNTDVMVKRESSISDSRQSRESIILKKYELGLYGNPQEPDVRRNVMNMLDDAVVADIYSDDRKDEALARWENDILLKGEADVIVVNAYDNHVIHAKKHTHVRKSREYQQLKLKDPKKFQETEMRFLEHTLAHQKFIDQQREQMMREMEGAKGVKS
jgi:hypothetical protein